MRYEPHREHRGDVFRWRLGIRPLDIAEWFIFDEHYEFELKQKQILTKQNPHTVFAAIQNIEDEIDEVTHSIRDHLSTHHAEKFHHVQLDSSLNQLAAIALHVQEDLVLMVERDGRLIFGAGSVHFPNRWDLRSKLGLTMREVHAPVASLNAQLEPAIDDFLTRLSSDKPVWRLGWGVIDSKDLYQPTDGTASPRPLNATPADHYLRVERETLTRFPRTNCVLFTIRTFLTPLTDIARNSESALALANALDAMPDDIAEYKQLSDTGSLIAAWLRNQRNALLRDQY
jgi:dimethylamine monooxygenase subunit A